MPQAGEEQAGKAEKGPIIRVGVEEVRLDAVVVDKNGRQITDLTAEDFEIYQDGQPQRIISSTYIAAHQVQPGNKIVSSRDSEKIPPVPTPALTREAVRRTIVFLVDDLSMSFADLSNARMALQKFVETQMRPDDLIAIMQTKGLNAGLQIFSSDKRQLLARIGNLRWNSIRRPDGYPIGIPQILSLAYSIRALQDMPGRKFLLLLSTQVMLPDGVSDDAAFNGLADAALRAGVVIHTLDILGVVNDSFIQQITENPVTREIIKKVDLLDAETRPLTDTTGREFDARFGPTAGEVRLGQSRVRDRNRPFPLSQKSGGFFLTGNNFFVNGIGAIEEEMKGYYLLSYAPPTNTFKLDRPIAYHKLKIKVKRSGTEVRTRDGFFGAAGSLGAPDRDLNPLMEAMFSPFRYNDLKINLAAGFIDDPQKGYLLRAWLHVDGQLLRTINEKDGGHSISLEAVATTSDVIDLVQDSGNTRIGFRVNNKDIEWIKENGIKFSLSLPAKKPGAYYVRVAVKDQASGAIGSAYQYVEIPDLAKDGLSLSSIFIINRDEDAAWIQSGGIDESQGQTGLLKQVTRRSQAFRRYLLGESFNYMAVIYNAITKEALKPDLESQFVLFQNGNEIFRSNPETVSIGGVKDFKRIPIKKKLKLEKTMQPGDYVLQLQVRDKQAKENKNLVAQTLDFEIASKTSGAAASQIASQQGAPVRSKDKTVIDMTAEELRKYYRNQLSFLKFSQSQNQLDYLLKQAGDRVTAFFRDFSNTASKERIDMFKANNSLETERIFVSDSRVEEYQYLILPGSGKSEASWVEDRIDKKNRPVNQKDLQGFIMSSGHAGKCLYLHPSHQANSQFRYLGRETKKPGAHVIAFAQKPEARDYLATYSDAESRTQTRYLVQGFVWLDPDSYQILRMCTSLLLPEKQTTLKETTTDIYYGKVQFDNRRREFWLPQEIKVTWSVLQADGISLIYWNQHKYSDYHFFTVDTDYEITPPKVNK